MTYDTFESLKVGDKVTAVGKKRVYPVVRIGTDLERRVVYLCINPFAVKTKADDPMEFGIFCTKSLDHRSHYINWERVS